MRKFLRTSTLTLAVCAAPLALSAQGMPNPRPPAPTPVAVEASAPMAVRAREVINLIVAGDAAALEAFVRQNASPEYLAHPQLSTILADLARRASEGPKVIVGYSTTGNGIFFVDLATAAGGQKERTIMVAMTEDAPYNFRRISLREPRPQH